MYSTPEINFEPASDKTLTLTGTAAKKDLSGLSSSEIDRYQTHIVRVQYVLSLARAQSPGTGGFERCQWSPQRSLREGRVNCVTAHTCSPQVTGARGFHRFSRNPGCSSSTAWKFPSSTVFMWMCSILIPRSTVYGGCDDRSGEQLHTYVLYSSNCAVLAYPRIVGLPVCTIGH